MTPLRQRAIEYFKLCNLAPRTTTIYTHVSPTAVETTQSPLDRIASLPGEFQP